MLITFLGISKFIYGRVTALAANDLVNHFWQWDRSRADYSINFSHWSEYCSAILDEYSLVAEQKETRKHR